MTSTDYSLSQAWPTCALGAWASAWIAGRCSPDDVIDTLSAVAGLHTVDETETHGERTDHHDLSQGIVRLLTRLRHARAVSVRLPGPGAPQGLPPDPVTDAAFASGEVLLVDDGYPAPLALIPTEHDGSYRWRVLRYQVPVAMVSTRAVGDIEYELRGAVLAATELIAGIGGRAEAVPPDLRPTIAALTQRNLVELPPHDDQRATRLLATAAHVEAIVTVASSAGAEFGHTAHHRESGDSQLRALLTLTRAARAAAVNRVIDEFLPAS